MSRDEYQIIATGWAVIMVSLTLFWFFTLRKLEEILKGRAPALPAGMIGMLRYLLKGEFKGNGDERLEGLCNRLRQLLYGYMGGMGAFIVFLVLFRGTH